MYFIQVIYWVWGIDPVTWLKWKNVIVLWLIEVRHLVVELFFVRCVSPTTSQTYERDVHCISLKVPSDVCQILSWGSWSSFGMYDRVVDWHIGQHHLQNVSGFIVLFSSVILDVWLHFIRQLSSKMEATTTFFVWNTVCEALWIDDKAVAPGECLNV